MIKDLGKVGLTTGFFGSEQDKINYLEIYLGNPNTVLNSNYGTLCMDIVNNKIYRNYDGSSGWESLDSKVGEWIDGRGIYRSIIPFTKSSLGDSYTLQHNLGIKLYVSERIVIPQNPTDPTPNSVTPGDLLSMGYASNYSVDENRVIMGLIDSVPFLGTEVWFYIVDYVRDEVASSVNPVVRSVDIDSFVSTGMPILLSDVTSGYTNSKGNSATSLFIVYPFSEGELKVGSFNVILSTPIPLTEVLAGNFKWYPLHSSQTNIQAYTLFFKIIDSTGAASNPSYLTLTRPNSPQG